MEMDGSDGWVMSFIHSLSQQKRAAGWLAGSAGAAKAATEWAKPKVSDLIAREIKICTNVKWAKKGKAAHIAFPFIQCH